MIDDNKFGNQKAKEEIIIRRTPSDYGMMVLGSSNGSQPEYQQVLQLRSALFATTHHLDYKVPTVYALHPSRFHTDHIPPPQACKSTQ